MADIKWTLKTFTIDELTDYYKNPRQLTEQQYKQLKTSLDKYGMIDKPIINADKANTIIGGHQRVNVLRTMGAKSVECWAPDRELTDREVEELNVRLNKNTGEWDFDMLANSFEFDDLLEWGFSEEELIGFDDGEDLDEGADVEPQIDRAEELREKWGVDTGQIWRLGNHRIICGDCTDRDTVERLMDGEKADILINDPPYGMRLDADYSSMVGKNGTPEYGKSQGKKYEAVIGDDEDYDAHPIVNLFSYVKEQFWFGADYYSETLGDTMHTGAWMVWDKRLEESADKMFGSCFELIWTRAKHKRDILRHKWVRFFGLENEPEKKRFHPNQKPISLYSELLEKYSGNNAIVVDCYSGSGALIIACENLKRKCRAIEISPAYVAVAIQRWADLTGGTPEMIE